ncbi:hypothetical protein [Streptomyces anandii]|uniref:PknH-like extracellular domain-containing protein n=1 Tax=Streptomyces anandii TaxID=285454 RepID=A0ABW6GZ83_9ACTN
MRTATVTRLAAGVLTMASAAACASGVQPLAADKAKFLRPMSAAQLRTHLLPAVLPKGWTSQADPADPGPGSAAKGEPHCAFLDGGDVADAGATDAVASATASFGGGHSAGGGVMAGGETLYSFSGEGAAQAMVRIRQLAAQCAKVVTPALGSVSSTARFAAVSGPHLGDDSIRVRATTTWSNHAREVQHDDALVVRESNTLIVIWCVPATQAEVDMVLSFIPEAVAQVRSQHPAPVDAAHRAAGG